MVLSLFAATAVSAGCGSDGDESSADPRAPDSAESTTSFPVDPGTPTPAAEAQVPTISRTASPPTFSVPVCNDTGGGSAVCAAGFVIDDRFYALSCGAVRPDVVSDEVLAVGDYSGRATEVRRIKDVDPGLIVAVLRDGGMCAEGDVVLSPWSMAFPAGAHEDPAMNEAVCRVFVEQHRERNHCT